MVGHHLTISSDRALRVVLRLLGTVFIFGIYPLALLWPSGWIWQPHQPEYFQMIIAVFAVLGVFLLLAARDPLQHLSLIRFTVWSSMAHGAVMAVHAVADPAERGHLLGDVPALFLAALMLALALPSQATRQEGDGRSSRSSSSGWGGPVHEPRADETSSEMAWNREMPFDRSH